MMQREQWRNRETREEPAAGGQEGSTHLSEMVSELRPGGSGNGWAFHADKAVCKSTGGHKGKGFQRIKSPEYGWNKQ